MDTEKEKPLYSKRARDKIYQIPLTRPQHPLVKTVTYTGGSVFALDKIAAALHHVSNGEVLLGPDLSGGTGDGGCTFVNKDGFKMFRLHTIREGKARRLKVNLSLMAPTSDGYAYNTFVSERNGDMVAEVILNKRQKIKSKQDRRVITEYGDRVADIIRRHISSHEVAIRVGGTVLRAIRAVITSSFNEAVLESPRIEIAKMPLLNSRELIELLTGKVEFGQLSQLTINTLSSAVGHFKSKVDILGDKVDACYDFFSTDKWVILTVPGMGYAVGVVPAAKLLTAVEFYKQNSSSGKDDVFGRELIEAMPERFKIFASEQDIVNDPVYGEDIKTALVFYRTFAGLPSDDIPRLIHGSSNAQVHLPIKAAITGMAVPPMLLLDK
jgi:hypothetical protein